MVPVPTVRVACAGWASALLAMVSVMKPASAMAMSTIWPRRSAPKGLRLGASRDGDFTRPASMAASLSFTCFAGLPK